MVKNLPAMQATWAPSLSQEHLLEKGIYPFQYSCLENSMNRGILNSVQILCLAQCLSLKTKFLLVPTTLCSQIYFKVYFPFALYIMAGYFLIFHPMNINLKAVNNLIKYTLNYKVHFIYLLIPALSIIFYIQKVLNKYHTT